MFTTTIIDDLHELANEIESLLNELNEIAEERETVENLTSYLK